MERVTSRRIVVTVPSDRLAADLGELPDDVELLVWPMDGPAPREAIDMVVPPYMSMKTVLSRLEGVETGLIQSQSIGYEGVEDLLPSGHVFANAASVHETSTAELAVGLAIAAQRRIDRFAVDTAAGRWESMFTESLADRRVLLLGWGGVGKAVAARLAGFEVDLTVVASRARVEDGMPVHGVDELPALLGDAEIVILTLPGGDSTHRLVDDAFLSALPDGALIVNVGRGSLVDTDALVAHVERGRVRAALDVTDPEPLPEGHPLWSLPGVLITPHVGGASSAMTPRIARLVRKQIDRLRAGDEPLNVVLRG
ncbi:2-hydroxyacid dehydrogenase [Microbacterium aurantiacum]